MVVSSSAGFRPFLLSMCNHSLSRIFPLASLRMVLVDTKTSEREWDVACFRVSSSDLSSNFGARSVRSRGSEFWVTPCDGPFLSRFLRGVMNLLRIARCASVPRILCLSVKIDLDLGGSASWDTQQLIAGTVNLPVHKDALLTESAFRLCLVMLTTNCMTDSWTFHWCCLCTVFDMSFQKDYGLWELSLSTMFSPSLFVCGSGAGEDERVDFPRYIFFMGETTKRLLFCTVLMPSTDGTLLAPFQRWQVSLYYELSPVLLTRFFHIWPQSFGLWSSDPFIPSPWSSTFDSLAVNCVCSISYSKNANTVLRWSDPPVRIL